jgi:uncharacterized membrane protein SpoIIM required for sporulation
MAFADVLQAVIDGYRSRADELLPAYFLSPAVTQVARVVVLVGLAAAYASLAATGRLSQFRADLRAADPDPPGPDASIEAYGEWIGVILSAVDELLTPWVIAIVLITILLATLVWVVLNAVATAAQLGCCWAVIRDRRGTTAAIGAARRYWAALLGLFGLQLVFVLVVTAIVIAPVVGVATISTGASVALAVVLFVVWLAAIVSLRAVFAFAAVAVVVEDVGVLGGLRGSVRFGRHYAGSVLGYLVAVLGVYMLVGTAAASGGGGNPAVSGLIGLVVAAPALDLLRTGLYGDAVGSITPPDEPERSVLEQIRAGVRDGVDEMGAFVARHPGLHVLAAGFLLAGGIGGWILAGAWEPLATTSIEARLSDHTPRTAVLSFTTNNVGVAVSTAFSGLAYGIPAGVSLVFNGAVLGVIGRLETGPIALAAFVLPHGLVEMPAFVIAGAVGGALGADAWRATRGRIDRPELADTLERSFRIMVGVAVLLAGAGLIEGLISPYYFRPFLG